MSTAPPLPVLLSQVLVACVIEFDNEFERRVAETWARPFRVSMVMWSNFMRFVREEGVTVGDLVALSRIPKAAVGSVVGGMERWGYVTVDHDPAQGVPPMRKGFGTARGLKPDTMIRPSMTGTLARELWEPLAGEVEDQWKARLGDGTVEGLRDALGAVQGRIDMSMPHFLPIVSGRGLFAHAELDAGTSDPDDDLAALLSRVLLAFTLDHEDASEVSLPIGSNVLRVLDEEPAPVGDLPLRTGVSKEAVAMSMTWLERAGHISVEKDPDTRGKVVALTSEGARAQAAHDRVLEETEARFTERFGADTIGTLREALRCILDQPGGEDGPLSAGLVPPPGGWRGTGRYEPLTAAFIENPSDALPHYPMVLHRGGWPDGS